ncbi:MAG: hypothetical protein HY724_09605 [Candidatus Rokubacteria bacterium]|nr:hypothetical protein [Candidatus Rokubacteria bacterium]
MSGKLLGLGVLLVCLLGSAPLSAASFFLTERETEAAIRVGRESVTSADFGQEWRVDGTDGSSLTVLTPFHRLTLAARNAAFKKGALRPRDIEQILKEHQGKLLFLARLHGGRVDFARWYQPVLLAPGREATRPSFVQNERTALRQEDGRYLARCLYSFPTAGLSARARVTLLIRDSDGKDVARFTVDLGAMR